MYCYLSKHPRKAASPETMGLFTSYFPKLENITTVPQGVLGIFGDKINVTGWKSLLKYFLDYTVRSNQSFCYSNNEINNISELKRFNTTKRLKANGKRRSVKKPEISEGEKGSKPACAWLLATLYDGNPSDNMNSHREEINTALDCLWNELTSRGLITQKIGDDDAEEGWYLNLDDLSFTLYDDVYFTNFATKGQAEAYRPTDTIFNGYTYVDVINRKPYKPTCTESHWSVFNSADAEQGGLAKWAQENRPYFWNNGLWGENGMFANRLNTIYNKPNLFIQAEHTAQVDKAVAKQTQKDFENGKINVLACSTTMEMGVDIGELELVVMNSVPPQPSNYKQRSGRSGRGIEYKPSASVTLCGSDAIGLRVMRHPMKEIIDREMAVPFVDWNCTKVIQRHLNAFLLRCALPIIQHDRQNPIMEKVIDFFTPFHQGENVAEIYHHDNNQNIVRVSAESGLGWGEDNAVSEEDEQIAAVNFINKLDDEKREENWKEIIQSLLKRTSLLEGDTLSPDVYSALINNTLDKLNDCIDILRDRMDYLKTKMQKATVDDHNVDNFQQLYNFFREHPRNADKKSISHLNYSYAAILNESLLEFLAKNRFSPNANMPVDIIEFDVNNNNSKRKWERNVSSNPSYPLREALMQYAPGNSVVLDNKNYIVAGIRSTGKYRNLYRNLCVYKHSNDKHSNEVIVEEFLKKDEQEKSDLKPLFEKAYNTDLVVPYSFCPDCNVSEDRSDASFVYSEVQAYLIGATDFNTSDLHLFSTRSSDEEKDAKILYINVGKGYGYCICKKCGRAAIEDSIKCVGASNEDRKIRRLPNDFYYYDEKTKKYLKQHNDVIKGGRCDYNKRYDIRRNAVIGSLIQTDFCEISLRDQFNNQLNDKDVITTLAIVFTKVFIGYIGKEERDVDFTVMPNNNICIFDTNPGGSGYSNKLDDAGTMKKIVDLSIELLNDIKSKDELLSQHTLKYIDKLNVKGAKTWLNREKEKSSSLLGEIREIYPNASVAYFNEIRNAIKNNSKETISLFFDDDFEKWNYEENGWRQLDLVKYQNVNNRWNTYIIGTKEILPPTLSVMFRMSNWCTLHRLQRLPLNDGTLYPIAIIGHDVFFTKDYTAIHMGNDWGHGTLYRTTIEDLQMDSQKIELNINNQNTILFMLNDTNSSRIQTTELGNLIYNNAQDIMNRFFEHCRNHTEERIHISYQDEHLKSMYSILLTLQTIEFFVGKFTNKFSLEFLNEIYFDSSNSNSFTSNFPTSYRRDEYLRKKANNWINKFNGTGTLQDIKSKDSKSLSHWRALTLTCAGKKLSIYPDGGFANGWKLGKNNDRFNENTDTTAIINVNRIAEIKYDVDLRDIDN
jgi:DEAD/DEAH box helicase domain-containing protein